MWFASNWFKSNTFAGNWWQGDGAPSPPTNNTDDWGTWGPFHAYKKRRKPPEEVIEVIEQVAKVTLDRNKLVAGYRVDETSKEIAEIALRIKLKKEYRERYLKLYVELTEYYFNLYKTQENNRRIAVIMLLL